MARRAAIFQDIAKNHKNVLHLDAGNMYGRRTDAARAQTEFLLDHVAKLDYPVLAVGQWDLNYGLDFLKQQAAKHNFHYISANLKGGDSGKLLFDPYAVVKRGGLRIGLISVIGPSYVITTMSAKVDKFVIDSPRDALEKYLPELRKKSDLIVLLSGASTRDTRELLTDLGTGSGIDICVEGADLRQYRRLNRVGDVYLVSANPQGKYLGQLDLQVTPKGVIQDAVLTLHELGKQAPQIDAIQDEVDKFLKGNEKLSQNSKVTPHPDKGLKDEKYLGTLRCSNCHKEIFTKYQETAHAKAWQTLVAKGQTSNPDCVGCHVTGWDYYNGFDPTVSSNGRNTLFNVQCEACHGYGTMHARDGEWAAQAKKSCTHCHTPEFDPDFDYDTYWARIAH